jgi:hypothetical protein
MQLCSDRDFDATLRFQRGAGGFLDYQTRANNHFLHAFEPLTERFNPSFRLFLENLVQVGSYATACEIQVRENQKAVAFGRKLGEPPYGGVAVDYNEAAMKAATRARHFLKEAMQAADGPISPVWAAFSGGDAREAMDSARKAMFQQLVEINMKPDDFEEVMKIWGEVAESATSVESLGKYLDENIAKFLELRSEDDRGNRPHSPLPWWKYLLIATIIGGAIFGVVACFVWGACTWMAGVIAAAAPWVFGIIDRGC